jgi:hypothetical protein
MDAAFLTDKVAARLKAIAEAKAADRSDLTGALNVSDHQLDRIMRGQAPLTVFQLFMAARALGVLTSVILGELNYDEAPARKPEM